MLNQNLLLTGDDGYNLTNSLRFRSSASAYLNRTPASTGNRRTWTWSAWVKRGALGSGVAGNLFQGGTTSSDTGSTSLSFYADKLYVQGYSTNWIITNAVFRDPSAWYHVVLAMDSTQATGSNRLKLYVNGFEVSYGTYNNLTQNTDYGINQAASHVLGQSIASFGGGYFDGYMTEVNFIDGQALTPSSFGSTNALTGVWQPAKYTGTYGTNGFYLPFTDNSALTTSSNVGLGRDYSGNGNYWTTNNISITAGSTYDSMTDVPTLTSATTANYAVMNPLNSASSMTPSGGNLNVVTSGVSVSSVSTIAVNSGKWYCEITIANVQDSTILGIAPSDRSYLSGAFFSVTGGVGYYQDGTKFISGSQSSYGASYTTNDVIGIALDMDAGTVAFYKNNTSQGTAASGLTGGYYFAVGDASSGSNTSYNVNFGQRPFAYTPPTGFVALNTFNLPEPSIKAGNKHFDIGLYTGNGSATARAISGVANPDFVWIKGRSIASSHALYDILRGFGKRLYTNVTNAEYDYGSAILAPTATGFNLTTADADHNSNGSTYLGWQWKANGTGVSNTAGSITSTVSANPTAGFSVVTYTGNSTSGATVGHGLNSPIKMLICKQRNGGTYGWNSWHTGLSEDYYIALNSTSGQDNSVFIWDTSGMTSTLFTHGSDTIYMNNSGSTYVAYCFAEVAGYSKFGSYTGNGSTDGAFVYTGFRPRFVMVKRTDAANWWQMYDTARNPSNAVDKYLGAQSSDAEYTATSPNDLIDFNSNGFKIRGSNAAVNASGGTYIYMAFAENPTKYALAR